MPNQLRTIVETRLLPRVERPMRYAGGELNCFYKDLSKVSLHGVLCFPDLYDIGMSHTGLQILYHIINKREQWALSRCFHPWTDAEALMRKEHIALYTLEYFSPVRDADFVGFTVQYELQFTNIINMLDLAGLHPLRSKRSAGDPLIIAGGPCVGNPEPLADFIDAFVIGDGEETIVHIANVIESAKKNCLSRKDLLRSCAAIAGVYVPAFFPTEHIGLFQIPGTHNKKKIEAAKIPELSDDHYPQKPIVPLIEVVHKRLAVEVMRGCTRGCRFCSAGIYYRPVRERSSDAVCSHIRDGIASTGWDEFGLLSLSTADYSSLSSLLQSLHTMERNFPLTCSLPSTRVDALTCGQLDLLENVSSISSFTIAPEAGSERLRRVINKDFTDEIIYDTVKELMRRNVQTLKLYFMLGLPTEERGDIDALITMVEKIAGMVRSASGRRMVRVSLSPFSPKPHTPFQREQMEDPALLLEKGVFIKKSLNYLKNLKISYRNPDQTVLETLMARGDRRIASLIYDVWQRGARFDGWDECFDLRKWIEGAAALSIDPAVFLQSISTEQILPWSAISTGVSEDFLEKERQRAYREEPTADCRKGECLECGACSSTVKRLLSIESRPVGQSFPAGSTKTEPSGQTTAAFRFYYQKIGTMRFLGHLDMVAAIHRAAHMAGYPLVCSNGFNPHPRIAFGPPLPFGIAGSREAFDVVVQHEFPDDPLIINRWLPEGLHIIDFKKIALREQALNAAIFMVRYHFSPIIPVDVNLVQQRIASILSNDSLTITAEKKGIIVEREIRKGIIELSALENRSAWSALLVLNGPGSCKPADLLGAMFPEMSLSDVHINRDASYDSHFRTI